MNNRVSFASVLKGNHHNQNSFMHREQPKTLSEFMEFYMKHGDNYHGYTLNLDHSGNQSRKAVNMDYQSYEDYEDGVNPLDAWVSTQVYLSNENFNNQSQKKSNNLMKFGNSNSQSKDGQSFIPKPPSKLDKKQPQKNMNMGQLCRMYAEQKDSCQSSFKDPVWKFGSNHQEQNSQLEDSQYRESVQKETNKYNSAFSHQENEQYQEKMAQVREDQMNDVLKRIPSTQKTKKNLTPIVKEIKDNLVPDIESMAEQIIANRRKEEDEDMLISHRSQHGEKERIQNAKKQIGEYLKIKQSNNKKEDKKNIQESNQQEENGVGYSFSHEFNEANRRVEEKKKQSMLPNIEQVRSQQDYAQNHHEPHEKYPEIDTQYIQQIQSVAYCDEKHGEDKVKQNRFHKVQPPVINLSLENYTETETDKSEQKINEIVAGSKEEIKPSIYIRNQVKENMKQVNSEIEKVMLKKSKNNRFIEEGHAETDSLQINSILHQPELNSITIQKLKEQEEPFIENSIKSSFKNMPNEEYQKTCIQLNPNKLTQTISNELYEKQPQQLMPKKYQPKSEHPKVQFKMHIIPQKSIQVEEKPMISPLEKKQQQPKRLLKITLSPKFQHKPIYNQTPTTNAFTLHDKTNEEVKNQVEKQSIPQKVSEEKKENNEHIMNKIALKQSKMQPELEMKDSVKTGLKESMKVMERKKQPLIKISNKKSVKQSMSMNNSLAEDFQFDLDI